MVSTVIPGKMHKHTLSLVSVSGNLAFTLRVGLVEGHGRHVFSVLLLKETGNVSGGGGFETVAYGKRKKSVFVLS